jgi:dTDP-glucose 4,6-dehydratase
MTPVEDRPGHDRRYAITTAKLTRETGWTPQVEFEEGLTGTVRWYRENAAWIAHVRSGEYRQYYEQNYGRREEELRRLVK